MTGVGMSEMVRAVRRRRRQAGRFRLCRRRRTRGKAHRMTQKPHGPARTPGECREPGSPSDCPGDRPAGIASSAKRKASKGALAGNSAPAIWLASHHARPEIAAHLRFSFPDSGGRGAVRPGTPRGSALADRVSADEPQARRLPVPRRPAPRDPGTMPPPASEPELNRFLSVG
jgi:hypothetical protein